MEGIAVQDIAMKGTVVGFFAMLVRFPVEISILTSYSCQVVRFLTSLLSFTARWIYFHPTPSIATLLNELYKARVQ